MDSRFKGYKQFAIFVAMGLALCGWSGAARAAIQSYQVSDFTADGFTASWLQSAEMVSRGSAANGALFVGKTTSRLTGTLSGDLVGNQLNDVAGSVSGTLSQLAMYDPLLAAGFNSGDAFVLKLGTAASSSIGGAIAFETNGAGTGEFTGGFFAYSLEVAGKNPLQGTFFFKPQAEFGSSSLSPNRGDSDEFTLWGNNWMHDGGPAGTAGEVDLAGFQDFLSDLGYTGADPLLRDSLTTLFGLSLFLTSDSQHMPEPATMLVWGMLGGLGLLVRRRD